MSAFSATNRIHFLQSAPVISLRRHEAVVHVTKRIAESDATVPEVKACIAALRLMLQILNWEFQYNTTSSKAGINVFSSGVTADCSSPKRSECILVQPGPAWQDVLILSGHIAWLLGFYAALREKFSRGVYWLDCPLAVSARKLIVQLCSLTGTVFHSSLPPRYRDSVRAITPGLPLFLYNYTTHQLHGIFEAASFGGSNIDPTAWEDKKCKGESRFPAQVNIALEEDSFRLVLHHYDGPKFRLELSVPETLDLLDLCEQTGSST